MSSPAVSLEADRSDWAYRHESNELEASSQAKQDALRGDWQAVADRLIPFLERKAAGPKSCLLLARAGSTLSDGPLAVAAWDEFARQAPRDYGRLREAAGVLLRMGERKAALRYAEAVLAENSVDFDMALIVARITLDEWDVERAIAILKPVLPGNVANASGAAELALKRKEVFLAGAIFLAIRDVEHHAKNTTRPPYPPKGRLACSRPIPGRG